VLSGGAAARGNGDANKLRTIDDIVVIYEENHSFDNLYGGWERVRRLSDADPAHTTRLGQTGPTSFAPYGKSNTLVLVTYDEFGGQWDHVPPREQGNDNGPHDEWGPAPGFRRS
jgi:phospholipase C